MPHKAHNSEKDFDLLHATLPELLDRVEVEEDSALAGERFEIMENFGYETVFEDEATVLH